MAKRRMFSSEVTDTDPFFLLSKDAKLLWFCLGMVADDDGFFNSALHVISDSGVEDGALDELIDKGFVHRFESGVYVLMHWKMNNCIQNDRYHPTIYQEEFNQLFIADKKPYQLKTECIQDVSETYTQVRLDKGSLDKGSLDKGSLDKPSSEKERDSLEEIEGSLEGERETLNTPVFTADCPHCENPGNVYEENGKYILECEICRMQFQVDENGVRI